MESTVPNIEVYDVSDAFFSDLIVWSEPLREELNLMVTQGCHEVSSADACATGCQSDVDTSSFNDFNLSSPCQYQGCSPQNLVLRETYTSVYQANLELLEVLNHIPKLVPDTESTFDLSEEPVHVTPTEITQRPQCMFSSETECLTVKSDALGCPECSYTTSRPSDWRRHLRLVHKVDLQGLSKPPFGDAPKKHRKYFYCPMCSYRARRQFDLKRHLLAHLGRKYNCPSCDKVYASESSLYSHMRVHQGDGLPFKCRFCGEGFLYKITKHRHERTHSQEKPFVCVTCPMRFAQQSNLVRHKERFEH